jgi:hypothetical protein
MSFAAVRRSLLAHRVISLRRKICPLLDQSGRAYRVGEWLLCGE